MQMELDILFLDIDGVLSPENASQPDVFSPECVRQLKRIFLSCPELKIVFSTSWRLGLPFFALGWLWRQHDLPLKAIAGRTPDLHADQRGREIRKWLQDAPALLPGCRIRRFAAVDDEIEPLLECLPVRNVFGCRPFDGLTERIANELVRHFAG